ncbi:MAG TPA: hypothetical protein VK923_20580 [Euzebyales bacterium]|nr:hypothetical protein [Euzebyales bacterium]
MAHWSLPSVDRLQERWRRSPLHGAALGIAAVALATVAVAAVCTAIAFVVTSIY